MPILFICETRLRPGDRLEPHVHYKSGSPPTGQLPSVSLFVDKTFDYVLEDVSHLCTETVSRCLHSRIRAHSLTIVSVYARAHVRYIKASLVL